MRELAPTLNATAETLAAAVKEDLEATPEHPWTAPVAAAARSIATS